MSSTSFRHSIRMIDSLAMTQRAYVSGTPFPEIKPGVLRIYSMRFCPYAQRARLVLAHKNIPHETINISLTQKPEWFLTANPLGAVPVLQLDDNIIPESTATSEWLDDVYPDNKLQPADPLRKAQDRVLLENLSKLTNPFYKSMRAEASELEQTIPEVQKQLGWYEEKLKSRGSTFFGGSSPAMIDFFMWPFFERMPALKIMRELATSLLDPEKLPTLTSWVKAMLEVPAVKAVAFAPEQHAQFYKGFITGKANFDLFLEE